MWTRYPVTWLFTTKLCGSVPADPEIVKAWLDARKPRVRPPGARSIEEIQEEVAGSLARGDEFEEAECNILTFQRHQGVCCLRAATIRAHLKDCARVISNQYVGTIKGERSFSTRVINGLYHDPTQYWVPILRPDGTPVVKHDGERDKPVHPRPGLSALKRFEWIDPARLDFTLLVLHAAGNKPSVAKEDLHKLMRYGAVHGYGGERGDGEGRYTYTIGEPEEDRDQAWLTKKP